MADAVNAAESYCAAFNQFSAHFVSEWEVTDWSDGPIEWRFFRLRGALLPDQGWKIHISAAAVESPRLLSSVFVTLHDLKASFKLLRTVESVVFLNSGDAGIGLLGKIITVYPQDNDHARAIIERTDLAWPVSRGPEVQTDLHIRPGSAVSLRFGAFQPGAQVVSSTGVHEFALVLPDGSLEPDTRRLGGEQVRNAPAPPVECCPPARLPLEPNETFAIDGREYLVLSELANSPRTRIFLAADLDRLETVVLKVGRLGVAGDPSGADIGDFLKKEWIVLSNLTSRAGATPRVLGWHEGPWPILIMEDFRGPLLSEVPRDERIQLLPQLADALARVHAAGFMHGDVKLENAVLRGDRVGLIDFELAAHDGDDVTRTAGTRGYIGPEVATNSKAAFSRDIFALAGCTAHALLDLPPSLMPAGIGRVQALLRNEGAARAANLVAAFAAPDPEARPTARAAAAALVAELGLPPEISPAKASSCRKSDLAWLRRASIEAAQLVSAYAKMRPEGICWRNTHFMKPFECEAINIGAAGIILGLATIDGAFGRSDFVDQIEQGARWLFARRPPEDAAGMFTGNAGVALALAVAGMRINNVAYSDAARRRFKAATTTLREVDLFSGSAGVVWASCILSDIFQESWPLELARNAVCHVHAHAGMSAGIPIWSTDSETSYLGCAHGSAGVAMALGCWGRRTGDKACVDTALKAFKGIRAHGVTEGGGALRITTTSHRHHAVGNWCHGVAGYLWSILQGVGDHPAVRSEIDWAVTCLQNATSVGTPTYCHGLAGQLELWRMLCGIPRFQAVAAERAGKVARALRIMHHKMEGKCTWISDDPAVTTPDLWIGFLGPATAVALHVVDIKEPLLSGEWLVNCVRRSRANEAKNS